MTRSLSVARRARERQQLRARILDAARELFAAEGYDAVTIRRVAEQVEYTPPVIYQHFADKAALIREICLNDWREFASTFHDLSGVADPLERLAEMGRRYVDFALAHPNQYRLMFMTPPPADTPVDKMALDPEARGNPDLDANAALRQHVDDAHREGRFNPDLDDPAAIAHVLWQSLHGIVSMHIARDQDYPWHEYRNPRETARLCMCALMRGLTCDARR
jgi:AcrR family transcriptional regulator